MNRICTTIEQSQRLIELGIDVNTADMSHSFNFNSGTYELSTVPYKNWIVPKYAKSDKFEQAIPAWSLSALIDALPLGVDIHNISDGHKIYYYVEIYTKEIYMKLKHTGKEEICLSTERYENLVDACYETILKLHEQKLL